MLVGKGAKVDWRHESTGWTLLHTAVEHGMASSIRELVQLGADINAADLEGATPLHLAIDVEADAVEQKGREPDWNIVELLLGLGADTAIQDKHGKTACLPGMTRNPRKKISPKQSGSSESSGPRRYK